MQSTEEEEVEEEEEEEEDDDVPTFPAICREGEKTKSVLCHAIFCPVRKEEYDDNISPYIISCVVHATTKEKKEKKPEETFHPAYRNRIETKKKQREEEETSPCSLSTISWY